jgi:hypothetical protein
VIYFGDFNYRLADPRPASQVAYELNARAQDVEFLQQLYNEHDELKEQMRRKNIYEFSEGINNRGPSFIPTCKMARGRVTGELISYTDISDSAEYWKTGKQDQRVPSWCDRILYHKFGEDDHNLVCVYYDRFDVGSVMAKSDHAAVMSVFELS